MLQAQRPAAAWNLRWTAGLGSNCPVPWINGLQDNPCGKGVMVYMSLLLVHILQLVGQEYRCFSPRSNNINLYIIWWIILPMPPMPMPWCVTIWYVYMSTRCLFQPRCGTVELVKLMHDGYPNRCQFHEMLRFRGGSRSVCGVGISTVSVFKFHSVLSWNLKKVVGKWRDDEVLPELGAKGVYVWWSGKDCHFMHGWIGLMIAASLGNTSKCQSDFLVARWFAARALPTLRYPDVHWSIAVGLWRSQWGQRWYEWLVGCVGIPVFTLPQFRRHCWHSHHGWHAGS